MVCSKSPNAGGSRPLTPKNPLTHKKVECPFIGFAFRQGMKVTPDPNNSNFGPGQTSGSGDWLDPGGHSS
jgi:hypothetical protein